jgi:intraflagellar transport protein 46
VKIEQLHQSKPFHTVVYSRAFPEIDDLMQAWPTNMERELEYASLPSADLDTSLAEYTKVVAALLDIPVHESKTTNLIESLHCVFTLYSAFRDSGHFKAMEYPAAVANAAE